MSAEIESKSAEQAEVDIDYVREHFYDPVNFNNAMDLHLTKKLNLGPASMPFTGDAAAPVGTSTDQLWAALERAELDQSRARRRRIVAFDRSEPAFASFDVLRTKVLKSLRQNNWTTVAITSPESGCGKSVLALNLAFCVAKLQNCRVALLDLDFRRPQISAILGAQMARPTDAFLEGKVPIEGAFVRYGDNLAVSAGRHRIEFPAELLQSPSAQAAMLEVRERLGADVVLLDLPPVLGNDDVLAFLPNVDCALLAIGAGLTSIAQVHRCEQELASETNLVGMVLNKCQHGESHGYY